LTHREIPVTNFAFSNATCNRYDEASKKWLSSWIKSSPSTTLIVSHEKELLDGACSHMAEVRGKGLHWYVGNYSAFLGARDERIRVAKALYDKQCVEAAELEDFVRRFSANASKASQAQSRAKLLVKLRVEMRKNESAATVGPPFPITPFTTHRTHRAQT
jgi:ATP-binding cassette subfamily F protein 3